MTDIYITSKTKSTLDFLIVSNGVRANEIKWNPISYLVEIIVSTTNDSNTAASVGRTSSNTINHIFNDPTATYYYWAKVFDTSGNQIGDLYPSRFAGVAGNSVLIQELDLADEAVTAAKLKVAAIDPLGNLEADIVAAENIIDGAVNAAKLAVTAIDPVGNLSADQVGTDQLKALAITTGKLAANSITGAKIAANTITASNIAAFTITADQIAASTITGSKIAAFTIIGSNIAARTLTAANIAAGTITATEISASYIYAGSIAASQISAGTLAAGVIYAGNLSAAQITTGSLSADRISGGTLTGASLKITTAANDWVINATAGGNSGCWLWEPFLELASSGNLANPWKPAISCGSSGTGAALKATGNSGNAIECIGNFWGSGFLTANEVVSSAGTFRSGAGAQAVLKYTTGNYYLVIQSDRNLVYYSNGTALWNAGTSTSDERLKDIIGKTSRDSLSIINSLEVIDYYWKEDSVLADERKLHTGFSAQKVKTLINDAVRDADGTFLLNKEEIIPDLVRAVQLLSEEIVLLKSKL